MYAHLMARYLTGLFFFAAKCELDSEPRFIARFAVFYSQTYTWLTFEIRHLYTEYYLASFFLCYAYL